MKKLLLYFLFFFLISFSNSCKTHDKKEAKEEATSKEKTEESKKQQAFSASDIYSRTKSAIVLIIAFDQNQIPLSQGSGFFINPTTVITNFHVIEGASEVKIKPIGSDKYLPKSIPIKVSEIHDIAIIQTSDYTHQLEIDTSSQSVGEKVFAIGNPSGLEGTISEGIVSGIRTTDFDVIQITAPISPGSSGGPVLDEKGRVIGISTFTLANSQNLNFAVPVKYIASCSNYVPTKNVKKSQRIQSNSGIVMTKFNKESSEFYEQVSLKNNTNDVIKDIVGVLIYRDMKNEIIDYKIINPDIIIPPGLAKMFEQKSFDQSQRYHYHKTNTGGMPGYMLDFFKVDFRLLSYEIER
jgi:S1-C subfamily serine protease